MDIHQKNVRQQEQERQWKQLQAMRAREQQMQQMQTMPDKMHGTYFENSIFSRDTHAHKQE